MQHTGTRRHKLFAGGILAAALLAGTAIAQQTGGKPAGPEIELGVNKSLQGRQVFPADDPWNKDVSKDELDPNSDKLIASIGLAKPLHPDFGTVYNGAPAGISYMVVPGNQPKVNVRFEYKDESDPGPYPVPPDAWIEGGPKADGDRHVLILDRDNWKLYELFSSYPQPDGTWKAGSGAIFDLNKSGVQRPKGWTSADAAGLPIFPGLIRYDEVAEQKAIKHALRFTIVKSRHAYVSPATHYASSKTDPNLPPMGMRVRLKAGYDISKFSPNNQVILQAIKTYGMIVADNGSDWFVSGAPDPRWNDDDLHTLTRVKGSDFEVVKMGEVVTR
ncbi:MAG TPA: hypothetical protein VG269_19935 [Tepidisphaeraceae bacterium]|jgi:hypothetical protein|nr:hypothetical protein [Tepidisphaeraceae bacterium]